MWKRKSAFSSRNLVTKWSSYVIYRDNNVRKDMSYADTVKAIANLLASELPFFNEIHILNQWR